MTNFIGSLHLCFQFQYKYRILSHEKIALCAGVHGARLAQDATSNIFVNDKGEANTNKAGDLKVMLLSRCTVCFHLLHNEQSCVNL